jgi:hypothetical protein
MTTATRSGRRIPASSSVSHPSSSISLLTAPGDVGKILGEKWKELTEKERKPYDEKARVDKERYETEKARYQGVSVSASRLPR